MTRIITVGNPKGGVGKSTIATNLAALRAAKPGERVMLVDTDHNACSARWNKLRDDNGVTPQINCVQLFGRIGKEVVKLAEYFSTIIIDAAGADSPELRHGALISDTLVIPCRPGVFDAWATTEIVSTIEDLDSQLPEPLETRLLFFVNCANTNAKVNDVDPMFDVLNGIQLATATVSNVVVHSRIAFVHAASAGRGVHELSMGREQATAEISALYRDVFGEDAYV
ncbi:AAA family ATPase [Laribacter hongkongensis]|uniref:AAA family ATPase n=1 Tax=Laribacter hongkongensis TaxID=168471 RepID=UPI001EFC5ADF|nr:AAA family ATPase [Laribacter hongkongensis]MCG9060147.1 AAA family ATPase [Laribacter hongkongensis]MCG9084090.1 AAA family ATPase [Laribacter hongkongensis]MCG9087244.1 AAA family ATPase [Laribacter hongkongensis]